MLRQKYADPIPADMLISFCHTVPVVLRFNHWSQRHFQSFVIKHGTLVGRGMLMVVNDRVFRDTAVLLR